MRQELIPIRRKLRELESMARELVDQLEELPEESRPFARHQVGKEPLRDAKWAAEYLGVSIQRIYHLARTGSLPSIRMGQHYRFTEKALIKWLEDGGDTVKGHSILREVS
jgi:excisionase family DNA binding protein